MVLGLLDQIAAQVRTREVARTETRNSIDTWLSDYLLPAMQQFQYSGNTYTTGYGAGRNLAVRAQEISQTLPAYSAALRSCPPAFAAQMVRALVISQARFTFRNRPSGPSPRKQFGTRALGVIEHPATSVTTGQMLARMEWHAGLAGNAYVLRQPDQLRVLRPDWVAIVFGSQQEPEDAAQALDGELVGYLYANRGLYSGNQVHTILPDEMCHWSPIPDPEMSHLGMSWITPAIREIQNDKAAADYKIRYWANAAPQPLDARILTPDGWSTMGEMRVGSQVIGSDGQPHAVTGVYPQGERDIYRVQFEGGAWAECTLDHVWQVTSNGDRKRGVARKMTLEQILKWGVKYKSGASKWAVPLVDPIEYAEAPSLPLDPYLMGLLLGDGSFRGNGKGSGGVTLACAAADVDEVVENIFPTLPATVSISRRDRGGWAELYFRSPFGLPTRGHRGQIVTHQANPFTEIIRQLGLFDVIGRDKFIPDVYLYASVKDRVSLLQGLIDSDGCIQHTSVRFTTTSMRLAEDLVNLVGSLGGMATIRPNRGRATLSVAVRRLPDWIVPARLLRKAERYRLMGGIRHRSIVDVELVRRSQAQCIAVDSEDHLYVTDGFVLTHNTPNLVVKGIPAMTKAQFDEIVDAMEARHAGVANAFRTLYLTAGADASVVGNNFKDMDLKALTGSGETRIALLSRVPAPILGISEGLAGSSLNAGNFGMARRLFADTWVYPTLQDLAGSLADIVDVPPGAELWFDTADMPLLREDAKDAAEIEDLKATTITKYVREGFTAESAIEATVRQDVRLLKHTGRVSVQLQTPGEQEAAAKAAAEPELNLAR